MKKKLAIKLSNVTVAYNSMSSFSIKKSITNFKGNRKEKFVAVNGVSFEVEEGSVVGLIGKNGSGKSTLLRSIAGIFSVDEGKIELFGKKASLLTLGVGFQAALTGYENIFLSGMLMGFTRKEIESKLDEIIEFSELGDFIYKPTKTYSSGMNSKLAFSISSILDADIILIDEILSVGDIKFKKKSFAKIKSIIKDENKTIIIVSHSESTIKDLCDKVVWLHNGKLKKIGEPDEVVNEYSKFMTKN